MSWLVDPSFNAATEPTPLSVVIVNVPFAVIIGAMLSTGAVSVEVIGPVVLPALSVAVAVKARVPSSLSASTTKAIDHVPDDSVNVSEAVPPKLVRSAVTAVMVSVLLSPPAVSFQLKVMVSPILQVPPVPVQAVSSAVRFPAVTVGGSLSTVALLVSVPVVGPVELVAVTEAFTLVLSMLPDTNVKQAS